MAIAFPVLSLSPMVRASSVDTKQRLSYNPHRTYPKSSDALPLASPASISTANNRPEISISYLLRRDVPRPKNGKFPETYLGYETWLPNPPKVEKPRSAFNAASLAYIGDCIFELYARRHFLFPPLNIEEHNKRVMAVVRCEAQDAMLQKLINDNFLSGEERGVLRWGKNVGSGKTRTKKRAGVAVYNSASSLETLIGYLYLTNMQRLEEIMLKLGFCTGASSQHILENINGDCTGLENDVQQVA
ncbi:uncharacterized protein LOC116007728 isoform X1 [Ipomoea triloba]|uniref:uncharacterized protein LOC116007728 isoform X1 n=1 Tax=Ipomoea triloba TaxID=35885 RepID=UPI00125E86DB|nr:uncharacterized protein LOC116007728 isoform X1 [Ipomoea triloba]